MTTTLDPHKMKLSNGHTLAVNNRAARWQRIRIDRRHKRIMQVVFALYFLQSLAGILLGYLVVTG